jgi:hypothetical protein
MQKKAMIIEEKLNNPNIKILELEKKYWVAKSVIWRDIQTNFRELGERQKESIELAKDNIKKGFELVAKRIKELETKDIKSQSDLNLFTSTLKNQQNIISMIEWYSNNNNQNNIIPVNIQINIKD